jgi:ribosomal protein S18 acetylase RimI-like enzyme
MMAAELVLRDGSHAITWSLLQDDREELARLYATLDPKSQYHRFLSAVPRLTEPMLERLVDDVDGVDHVALVLFVFDSTHVVHPAAIGRMVRYPDDPTTADIAVTVLEQYRGRGIASALVDQLSLRRPVGVERVITEVAADNEASLAMLRRLGPCSVRSQGGNVLEVQVELPALEAAPASSP